MSHEYKIEVTREGRWWMIYVPEIDQLTQARRIAEVVPMAESLIAVSTNHSLTDITVHILSLEVPELGDVLARVGEVEHARNEARRVAETAHRETAELAGALTAAGVPVRDTADLLHVSPQRVSQLASGVR
jgi:hypothetical protein